MGVIRYSKSDTKWKHTLRTARGFLKASKSTGYWPGYTLRDIVEAAADAVNEYWQ